MSHYKEIDHNRITLIDYMLIIGIVIAPMTGLRIWKVGPSEILVLLWCLINIRSFKYINLKNYNITFWGLFLVTIIIGTCYALLFYPVGTMPSGILTYFYLAFISIGIYYGLKRKTKQRLEAILYRIALGGGLWYSFLYIYSVLISTRFLGAPLWYGFQRFSGGGTNPHQIAVFLVAVIFISYYFVLNCKQKTNKVVMVLNMSISIFISLETKSSTLVIAIVMTALLLVIKEGIELNYHKKDKEIALLLVLFFTIVCLGLYYADIYNYILEWIKSDPNGLGRFSIFRSIILPFSKSPLIGLGPGTHALGGVMELHNTYLEILAMGGILGLLVFSIYSVKIFNILKTNYRLVYTILPSYVYGLAGFAMRKLVYWGLLMIIIALAEKTCKADKDKLIS